MTEEQRRKQREYRQRPEVNKRRKAVRQAKRDAWSDKERRAESDRTRKYSYKRRGIDPNFTTENHTEMLKQQSGVCLICGEVDNDRALAVDHCHETGLVRGLLCTLCNLGIGYFKDDTDRLKRAIEYLTL